MKRRASRRKVSLLPKLSATNVVMYILVTVVTLLMIYMWYLITFRILLQTPVTDVKAEWNKSRPAFQIIAILAVILVVMAILSLIYLLVKCYRGFNSPLCKYRLMIVSFLVYLLVFGISSIVIHKQRIRSGGAAWAYFLFSIPMWIMVTTAFLMAVNVGMQSNTIGIYGIYG